MFTFRKSLLGLSILVICLFPSIAVEAKSSFAYIHGDNVNVRSKPISTAKIKTKLSDIPVKIVGTSGEWFKISYNGTEGWVKDDFVVIPKDSNQILRKVKSNSPKKHIMIRLNSKKTGTIKGTNVNLRAKPTKSANVVAKLSNKKIKILDQSGNWYKVSYGNTTGWVLKDFIITNSSNTNSLSKTSKNKTTSRSSSLRNNIVLYSRGFLGVRYRYGGESPRGFDCSGFTSYIYKKYGIDINRTAADQARQGTYVPKNKLRAGDLVFFDTNGGKTKRVNHAGLYIGNGKFIHASSSRKGAQVKISSLNEGYYRRAYVTGRSFVK